MNKTPYNSVSDERLQQLDGWLTQHGYNTKQLTAASADAGFRRYFRLITSEGTLIAVDAPPQYEDNDSFLDIASRLKKCGLTTPEIVCYNLENGFMLLSDLGTVHLQDAATPADTVAAARYYEQALQMLIKMQRGTATTGLPDYSQEHLQLELQIFSEWYLQRHLGVNLDENMKKTIQLCFDLCIDTALQQPRMFVHRDYHCRNLMVQPDKQIAIIDFQGAVNGPVTYDVVSLLKDAYIEWPESFINPLLEMHRASLQETTTGKTISTALYRQWFDFTGLQRHLKILGIFCRLHYRDGKSHYLNDLSLVRKHVETVCGNYPELRKFNELLSYIHDNNQPRTPDASQ